MILLISLLYNFCGPAAALVDDRGVALECMIGTGCGAAGGAHLRLHKKKYTDDDDDGDEKPLFFSKEREEKRMRKARYAMSFQVYDVDERVISLRFEHTFSLFYVSETMLLIGFVNCEHHLFICTLH